MGVGEMTRFGFGPKEFDRLAGLMAECILHGTHIGQAVSDLRKDYTEMLYCF